MIYLFFRVEIFLGRVPVVPFYVRRTVADHGEELDEIAYVFESSPDYIETSLIIIVKNLLINCPIHTTTREDGETYITSF